MLSLVAAVALMILSSFGFAGGAVCQHRSIRAAREPGQERAMTLRQLARQAREPMWLMGLVLVAAGTALHVASLFMAPVTVVQPIGILAVPWAVLLASKVHGHPVSGAVWGAVFATVAGIAGFTVVSIRFSHDGRAGIDVLVAVIAFVAGCVVSAVLFVAGGIASAAFRSLSLAAGGAVLFGLMSASLKSLFVLLGNGAGLLSPPATLLSLGIVVSCAAGGWMVQQAYAFGHPEVVIGALTTVDPMVAVLWGLVVLGEGTGVTMSAVLVMFVCGGVAAAGVAGLIRHHPETRQRALLVAVARGQV